MNIRQLFSDWLGRFDIKNWSRSKKMIMGAAGMAGVLVALLVFNGQGNRDSTGKKVTFMPKNPEKRQELNYDIIEEVDTLKIPGFPEVEKRHTPVTPVSPLVRKPESKPEPKPRKPVRKYTSRKYTSESSPVSKTSSKSRNMIVINSLGGNTVLKGGKTVSGYSNESVLVKVMLPSRTAVSTGSLVESRVIHDTKWKDIEIPRNTKLMGTASLFNRRIRINFQEIEINGRNRSCSGQAYDLKRLEGLPYSPITTETKRAVLEELRNAVSGIPVVGRVAGRTTLAESNVRDAADLEEGLEFYVFLQSIY